ncbi:MAG: hypothetical protein ABH883_08335 [Candidatus Omnitrophota bacterium]
MIRGIPERGRVKESELMRENKCRDSAKDISKRILRIYRVMGAYFGDLKWWPAKTGFEMIIGAILTQNTAWSNVEKAVANLREKKLLDMDKIIRVNINSLAESIRPAGYFRVKAERLKSIARFLKKECNGDLERLKTREAGTLREELLSVNGVGPETADCILVYAVHKPVFVVDVYAKRIFYRHGLISGEDVSYGSVQSLVSGSFPADNRMLNQFHALLVETGKNFCKKKEALCGRCPLKGV